MARTRKTKWKRKEFEAFSKELYHPVKNQDEDSMNYHGNQKTEKLPYSKKHKEKKNGDREKSSAFQKSPMKNYKKGYYGSSPVKLVEDKNSAGVNPRARANALRSMYNAPEDGETGNPEIKSFKSQVSVPLTKKKL